VRVMFAMDPLADVLGAQGVGLEALSAKLRA
jgi:hypothetical protein